MPSHARRPLLRRTAVDPLEDRAVPATFVVDTTGDAGSGVGLVGDLRYCITQANETPGQDTITFAIPGAGAQTISPATDLPALTDPAGVVIDGYTQPGAKANTLTVGTDAVLRVVVDGSRLDPGTAGPGLLTIRSANNTLRGLVVGNGPFDGVRIEGADATGNVVAGNFIGTDPTGATAAGNGNGVAVVLGAAGNLIGGEEPADRNVISGNSRADPAAFGVVLDGTGALNDVRGNYIGTTAAGTAALPNGVGVVIAGGTTGAVVRGNLISGNDGFYLDPDDQGGGVVVAGAGTSGNLIAGNVIGLAADGKTAVPNTGSGVWVTDGATANTVGGPGADGNLVSGNGQPVPSGGDLAGVRLTGAGTSGNLVAGNVIGLAADGKTAAANVDGVGIGGGASDNTVGGAAPGMGNRIAGNGRYGVYLAGAGTTNNLAVGNTIGLAADGTAPADNQFEGVRIEDGAAGNTVGGAAAGAGNVIAGNAQTEVFLTGAGTSGNLIAGNALGLAPDGKTAAGIADGVVIEEGAADNTVGGTAPGAGNRIAGGGIAGVTLHGGDAGGTTGNVVAGNTIGLAADGTPVGYADGVVVGGGAAGNTVGGAAAGAGNVISGNKHSGVVLLDDGTSGNLIAGNFIGTDAAGGAAVGNGSNGVEVRDGAAANTIGGPTPAHRNVISGNRAAGDGRGVLLQAAGSGNVVEFNSIGTDATGTKALPNGVGVVIDEGTTDAEVRSNLIAGNDGFYLDEADRGGGVVVAGKGTTGTLIQGNRIGTAADGLSALPNLVGVVVTGGATGTTIRGNLISGNGTPNPDDEPSRPAGVDVSGAGTSGTLVAGNVIGLAVNGTVLANSGNGLTIRDGATDNTVGGTTSADRNGVAGNTRNNIRITGAGTSGNLILGNTISLGADGTTAAGGDFGVQIDGGATDNTVGGAAGNTISGSLFAEVRLTGTGTSGNLVSVNSIGLAADGKSSADSSVGVLIEGGASDNTVGGSVPGAGNVISGNSSAGVSVTDPGTTGNLVAGNTIGLAADGVTPVGNRNGVVIDNGASDNTVGGTAGAGNLISGNTGAAVVVSDGGATGNLIAGNTIGLAADGVTPVGNQTGVVIGGGASDNTVGGAAPGMGNRIAGNAGTGVQFQHEGTTRNRIVGNTIGLTVNGTLAGNKFGVLVGFGATDNTVGGTEPGAGNRIAGNLNSGVILQSAGTTGNLVIGNVIGTDAPGGAVSPGSGVVVNTGASNNSIGGTTAAERNIISGHALNGVSLIGAGTSGNLVAGNSIGTDATGAVAVGNAFNGVTVRDGATGNTIGGPTAGHRNVISGNRVVPDSWGVLLESAGPGNVVEGNFIGTDATGAKPLPNGVGVVIDGGTTGTVVRGNLISGNDGFYLDKTAGDGGGVVIAGAGTSGNLVAGNRIGTTADGSAALPNTPAGVRIGGGATANTVGPGDAASANVISGNAGNGVVFDGKGTSGNVLGTNSIGTNLAGTVAIPNAGHGVHVGPDATGNRIGSLAENAGNLISGNAGDGVRVDGSENTVEGNYIGLDDAGAKAIPNAGAGVVLAGNDNLVTAKYDTTGFRQVIAGNRGDGVLVSGTGNVVTGNLIGTDRLGAAAVPNGGWGVRVTGADNRVGGPGDREGNLVSGNAKGGALIQGPRTNFVANYVGTDAAGAKAVGNAGPGVRVTSAGNTIGGRLPDRAAVLVSGNAGDGVVLAGPGATGNQLLGGSFGTDKTASFPIPNGGAGVRLDGASGNTIGGLPDNSNNYISGNAGAGVVLENGANNNRVTRVNVGTDLSGSKAVPNGGGGVVVLGSSGNTIGGPEEHARVVASGNRGAGILLTAGASGNLVTGNLVGTDEAGGAALGNDAGVVLDGATGNTVGGTTGNRIAGNAGAGVRLANGATGNRVEGNEVGRPGVGNAAAGVAVGASPGDVTTTGSVVLGNQITGNAGIPIDLGSDGPTPNGANPRAFPNAGQNYPVLSGAAADATRAAVTGTLTTAPGTYRLEFFAGPVFLGFQEVTADATGVARFTFLTTAPAALAAGAVVTATATATGASGTSEVSAPVPVGRVVVAPETIPNAAVGSPYREEVTASGSGVFRFAVTAGQLPQGLTLSEGGVLAGNPTRSGVFPFEVTATDEHGITGRRQYTLTVAPAIALAPTALPVGTIGVGYAARVTATGGTAPFAVTVTAGGLPPGLTLAADGTLSGTPTTPGDFRFTVTATDAAGNTAAREYRVPVAGLLTVDAATLPDGQAGRAYRAALTATGGTPPVTFALAAGALPPGLTLGRDGTLSGTPTAAGDFRFTATATDAAGRTAARAFAVAVAAAPPVRVVATRVGDSMAVRVTGPGGTGFEFTPFEPAFTGGMTLATADVTGDGVDDVVVGAGPGGGPRVVVYDGVTGAEVSSFFAFEPTFAGGVTVAAADTDGDGRAEVVAGAGPGGGPRVVVFDGLRGVELSSFFAFDPSFSGGVFVAAGDLDGDGRAEVIAGAGPGGGPNVQVFQAGGQSVVSFFAADPADAGGVQVGYAPRAGGGLILTTTATTGPRGWAVADGAMVPADLLGVDVG